MTLGYDIFSSRRRSPRFQPARRWSRRRGGDCAFVLLIASAPPVAAWLMRNALAAWPYLPDFAGHSRAPGSEFATMLVLLVFAVTETSYRRLIANGRSWGWLVPSLFALAGFAALQSGGWIPRMACLTVYFAAQFPLLFDVRAETARAEAVHSVKRIDRLGFDRITERRDRRLQVGTYHCPHCRTAKEFRLEDFERHRQNPGSPLPDEWRRRFDELRPGYPQGRDAVLDFECAVCHAPVRILYRCYGPADDRISSYELREVLEASVWRA
jgi:hypothetical protein